MEELNRDEGWSEAGEPAEGEPTVLVVVVNNRDDWARVQRELWYRLPVRRAPRQIAADYLAFYHTAAFDAEKWSIRSYAPVASIRLARRRELLPDEPAHPRAAELYYRFALGSLVSLERPLPSRRLRRITFIHTTLARLLQAEDVAELWLNQPLRERLWVELNRQGIHAERELAVGEGSAARAFDFVIPCWQGHVAVDCVAPEGAAAEQASLSEGSLLLPGPPAPASDWSWLRFEDAGWAVSLAPYLDCIWQEIRRRGGQL